MTASLSLLMSMSIVCLGYKNNSRQLNFFLPFSIGKKESEKLMM